MDQQIIGFGLDSCEIKRMEKLFSNFEVNQLLIIFTSKEINEIKKNSNSLFILFSIKEALLKMLGIGLKKESMKEIEVIINKSEVFDIKFSGEMKQLIKEKRIKKIYADFTITNSVIVTNSIAMS